MSTAMHTFTGFLASLILSTSALAAPEVKVLSSMNVPMTRYGMTWQAAYVRLRVQDRAYDKAIRVIFTDSEGVVTEAEAKVVDRADDGHNVLEAWTNLRGSLPVGYHAAYEINGQSYRIDDHGQDFKLKTGPIFHAGQNIQQMLPSRQFPGNYASFGVAVRNLGYQKHIRLEYACNESFTDSRTMVDLRYQPTFQFGYGVIHSPTADGFEMWTTGSIQVPEHCHTLHYYFTYDVNGQHYADTNFGHNYIMFRN